MDPYVTLRRHARERRDRDIREARERYAGTIDQIYKLQARNGQRGFDEAYYNRGVRFFSAEVRQGFCPSRYYPTEGLCRLPGACLS